MGIFDTVISYGRCNALLNRLFRRALMPPSWFQAGSAIYRPGYRPSFTVVAKKGYETHPRVPVVFVYSARPDWFLFPPEEVIVTEKNKENLESFLDSQGINTAFVPGTPFEDARVEAITSLLDKYMTKGR